MKTQVVLIELNEVPNLVLDRYRKKSRFMDNFLKVSQI